MSAVQLLLWSTCQRVIIYNGNLSDRRYGMQQSLALLEAAVHFLSWKRPSGRLNWFAEPFFRRQNGIGNGARASSPGKVHVTTTEPRMGCSLVLFHRRSQKTASHMGACSVLDSFDDAYASKSAAALALQFRLGFRLAFSGWTGSAPWFVPVTSACKNRPCLNYELQVTRQCLYVYSNSYLGRMPFELFARRIICFSLGEWVVTKSCCR